MVTTSYYSKIWTFKSRSEQAPGREFHPREQGEKKIIVISWELLGATKR